MPAEPSAPLTAAGHGPHAGLSAQLELTVAAEDTAEHFRSGDVPVLATPASIALVEEATCRATDGHLTDAQSSVATRVQFDHLAPVAVGSVVLAEATLVKVEGRRLTFTVSAARLEGDGGGLVGAGRVTRVVVDRSTFLAKAGAAGSSWSATPAHRGGPSTKRSEHRITGRTRTLSAGAGPVVAAFVTFGLFWGSWAVMLFDIQHTFSLNDAQLGVLLAVAIAVAGASRARSAVALLRPSARAACCRIALFAWSVLLCALALTHDTWSFAVALVLVEIAGGSIDTAMNAEASHRLVTSPKSLVRLRALLQYRELTGAAAAVLVIHAGVSWRQLATPSWPWSSAGNGHRPGHELAPTDRLGPSLQDRHPFHAAPGRLVVPWPSSPWRRSPRAASTPGVCCTCGTTWPPEQFPRGRGVRRRPVDGGHHPVRRGHPLGRLSTRRALIIAGCGGRRRLLFGVAHLRPGRCCARLCSRRRGRSLFWPGWSWSTVSRLASQVVSAGRLLRRRATSAGSPGS